MRASDAVRRVVDLAVAVGGLVVLAPVLALAGVAVRVDLGPGVLHRQTRIGLGGRPFELYKFRTMHRPRPGRDDPRYDDERITRFGAWLRSTSIDELPSLVNLLRGDISLVGPRPLPVQYWERFRGAEYERFLVRPGLSGLAQIAGRNAVPWPERLRADVHYVRTRSLGGDLRIVAVTVPLLVRRVGISEPGGPTMSPLPADRPPDGSYVDPSSSA